METLSAWQFRELNNDTWTREDGSCHCLVRVVRCTHGEIPVTMTLKVSPDYAAAPCEVSLIPGGLGAVISGGQQHAGLGIVGAYRVPSFTMSIAQEEGEMHPSVVVQANLQEGERLVLGATKKRLADWPSRNCTSATLIGNWPRRSPAGANGLPAALIMPLR